MEGIFVVLYVSIIGLIRCYKTTVFLNIYTNLKAICEKNMSLKNPHHERGYKTFKQDKIGMTQAASTVFGQMPGTVVSVHASQKIADFSLANWP